MRVFDQAYLEREFGRTIGCASNGDYYAMDETAVAECIQGGWTDEHFRQFLRERLTEYARVALLMRGVLGRMTQKKRAAIRKSERSTSGG